MALSDRQRFHPAGSLDDAQAATGSATADVAPAANPPMMELMTLDAPRVSLCGSAAVLLEAEGALSLATQQRIWRLSDDVRKWSGVEDVQPAVNNLLITVDPVCGDVEAIAARVMAAWPAVQPLAPPGQLHEFGVVYGGEHGLDLPDVAAHHKITIHDVVALHSASEYVVFGPGASPGFGYLFGLDPRLATPRRKVPSLRPYGGSVTIGGAQAGLGNRHLAGTSPTAMTGWHNLGQVPDIPIPFDPARDPVLLLDLGDRIRFRVDRIEA